MGQTGRAPATLSTSVHAEYERDQGRVSHHAIRMNDGFHHEVAAAMWSSKSPILGISSTKQSCPCMLGWGPRHKMGAVVTYIYI